MRSPYVPLAAIVMSAVSCAAADLPSPESLPSRPEIPDVLTTESGQKISSKDQWPARTAELKALVQNYEYGYLPPKSGPIEATVLHTDEAAFGGKATLRELKLTWGMEGMSIQLLLVTPNSGKPAPVFLGLNFSGNHTLVKDPKVQLPQVWMSKNPAGENKGREEDRGKSADAWCIEQIIDHGYGVATFFNGDVVPDEPKLAEAALARLGNRTGERGPTDAGTIAAWAWCLQRAVDYLQTDKAVDAKRIALVGHSRNGKTALLAAAFDERIALVIPSQAGCGGTSPARVSPDMAALQPNGRPKAETVAIINRSFPHWFSGTFKAFNDAPDKLPYDHNAMIALCAPRPVLISCATEDTWSNPPGQFEMLKAASPAYQLIAGEALAVQEMPAPGVFVESRLGYFIRPGKHSMNSTDWEAWLKYADKWLR